jgi:endo-1,4-beta-xylanase
LSAFATSAQAAPAEATPISWVNPKLPAGPGLTHYVLASKALGHDVGYVVWKPAGFDATKKYPVLYFLHGSGGTESADAAGFSGWVARGIAKGLVPPVIVVFPNGGLSGYRGDVDTMIVDELIPLIDRTQPTLGTGAARLVAGFSMGGAGAARLSLLHPNLFAAAASLGGREVTDLEPVAEKNAAVLKLQNFALMVFNGDRDHASDFKELAQKLEAGGVPCHIVIHPDLDHNLGRYYELSCESMLRFLGAHLAK